MLSYESKALIGLSIYLLSALFFILFHKKMNPTKNNFYDFTYTFMIIFGIIFMSDYIKRMVSINGASWWIDLIVSIVIMLIFMILNRLIAVSIVKLFWKKKK
jgi:hypothetical protein